jgi:hypothetical protein
MTLFLGGWVAWCLVALVAVYAVTQTARLEMDRVIHPVGAPVAGQTDVDGTSIDTLEEAAVQLGPDAEQIMVPVDHLLIPEA